MGVKGVKDVPSRQGLFKEDLDITAKGSAPCAGDSVWLELNTQTESRDQLGMRPF